MLYLQTAEVKAGVLDESFTTRILRDQKHWNAGVGLRE